MFVLAIAFFVCWQVLEIKVFFLFGFQEWIMFNIPVIGKYWPITNRTRYRPLIGPRCTF